MAPSPEKSMVWKSFLTCRGTMGNHRTKKSEMLAGFVFGSQGLVA